ncbi:hypothetical protein OY671_009186, partial [Metschnikowia pulcherrima]
MKVSVSDPYAQVDDRRFLKSPSEALLGPADYVICLAIANEETENLWDAAATAPMKPDAFFINMSRGNLVDEAALAKVLTEGRIAGAAMDVGRAPDQMPSPESANLPNVIATPHVGGSTPQAIEHQSAETVRQVAGIIKGNAPAGEKSDMKSRSPFYYGWMIVVVVFVTMAIGVNARTAFSSSFPPVISEFGW